MQKVKVSLLLCFLVANSAGKMPSDIYISMLHSQEKQAILTAISQVNADASLLPNTTLHFVESTFTESRILDCAVNMTKNNVSTIIFDSKPNESHDALSFMLKMPLISTETFRATPLNRSLGDYEISLGPSTISAMVDLIAKYKWINLVVLYDVRWRDHVTEFLSNLPTNVHYLTVDMILDRTGLIDDKSQKKILFLRNDPAEAVMLLCDTQFSEKIIKQVFPLFTFAPTRSHRWILADPVKSFKMEADSSQVIVGFAPRVFKTNKTTSLHKALSSNATNTRFASYLIFDAVFAFAHALHGVLVDANWEPLNTESGLNQFKNGDVIMDYIKKVNFVGTTGTLLLTNGGYRRDAVVDVINLRDGTFVKIGEWNEASRLTMTSPPTKNQVSMKAVPLSQLKRKLKIAVVEDPPFVMSRENPTTMRKEMVGFSIDLVKEVAKELSFDYEFYLSPDGRYGGRNSNGSLAGVIGEVFKGNADMSSMPLTINSERLQYIAFSKPFMFMSMDLIMQRPKQKEYDILGFMTPYDNLVWIMTLVTWLVVTAILSFVNYYSPYGHRLCDEEQNGDEFSWFNSLWFCLACMLQQGGDATPRMFSGRVIVGFFWFCILVWVSTYTANLASVLTTSQDQEHLNNLEEALEKEYHVYVIGDSAFTKYLEQSDYRVYRLIWERITSEKSFVNSTPQGFEQVRAEEHNVFIEESPFAEYLLHKKPCDVMSVKDVTGANSYGIAFAKENPYLNNISIAILRMQENGKLDDLKRKWWSLDNDCNEYQKLSAEEIREKMRIHMENMVGVYLVLAAGGVIGVIFIFIEKWYAKRRAKIEERVRKGWTVVKATTKLMKINKKSLDAGTVVEAFTVNIPAKTKVRPHLPWGMKEERFESPAVESAGISNQGYEGLESNPPSITSKDGPPLKPRKSWTEPLKNDPDENISSRVQFLGFAKRNSDSSSSIPSRLSHPSRKNSRVSYVEVVSSSDKMSPAKSQAACLSEELMDIEDPIRSTDSPAKVLSTNGRASGGSNSNSETTDGVTNSKSQLKNKKQTNYKSNCNF